MSESDVYSSLLALLLAYGIFLLARKLYSTRNKKQLPPSPPKLPIIGNLHQIRRITRHSLAALSNKYGPLMLIHLGTIPTIVISSAAVAKEVVKSCDVIFSGRPNRKIIRRLHYDGKGIIFSSGREKWRFLRSIIISHLLHKRVIKKFNSIRDEEISILLQDIDKCSSIGAEINLSEAIASLMNDIICRSAFGKKYRAGEFGNQMMDILKDVERLQSSFSVGEFIPWLSCLDRLSGYEAVVERVLKTKDELLDAGIQEYLENLDMDRAQDKDSFADVLAGIHKGKIPGVLSIDMDTCKATLQDIIGAGTDTTRKAVVSAMQELIRHPNILKKLQDEVRLVMNGKQQITDTALDQMQYMKAIVKETLRFHPPIPIMMRSTFEDVRLMSYDIPRGIMVLFNLWAVCRDPAYWEEPEKFMPERFLNSSIDYNGSYSHFIPFGVGRRICPGISFAIASIERVLANLVFEFDWQFPNTIEKPDGLVVGKKNPLIVVPKSVTFRTN